MKFWARGCTVSHSGVAGTAQTGLEANNVTSRFCGVTLQQTASALSSQG